MSAQRAAMLANLANQLGQLQAEGRTADYNLAMFGIEMKHRKDREDVADDQWQKSYDLNVDQFNEQKKQWDDNFKENNRRFEKTFEEQVREWNLQFGLNKESHNASMAAHQQQMEAGKISIEGAKRTQAISDIQNELNAITLRLTKSLGSGLDNAEKKFDLISRSLSAFVNEKYVKSGSPYANEAMLLATQAASEGEMKYVQDIVSGVNADAVESGIENNPESIRKFIRKKYGREASNMLLSLASKVSGENNQLPSLSSGGTGLFEKSALGLGGGAALSALGVTGAKGFIGTSLGAAQLAGFAAVPTLGEMGGRKLGEMVGEDSDNPDAWKYGGGAVGAAGSTLAGVSIAKRLGAAGTKEAWKGIAPLIAKRVAARMGATQVAAGGAALTGVGALAVPLIELAGAAWTVYDVVKLGQELFGEN